MDGLLSVIIPAYNEADTVPAAAKRLSDVLSAAGIPYELVFVDDGSKDATWQELCGLAASDGHVRGVSFSRNFGKEAAVSAGLAAAKGDCCVTIDCDLQHPPEKIPEMYGLWKQGAEVVEGVKSSRGKEGLGYKLSAGLFYKMIGRSAGFDMENASDFKLLDRKAVDVLLSLPEKNAFYRALSAWVGFRTASVSFDVAERAAGSTKWNTRKLVRYALSNLASFSSAPMQLVTALGAVSVLLSVILGIRALAVHAGSAAGLVVLMLFLAGVVMLSLGVIGYYLARMYDELKGRPRYIVARRAGKD